MYLIVAAYTNQIGKFSLPSLPQKQYAYLPYTYMQEHTQQNHLHSS